MNVYQKLQQARIKLQGKELKKSGHNNFAGYQYFELGDFLPSIQEIFNETGLCGTISFELEFATLRVTNVEDPLDYIIFSSPMSSAALKGCHEVQNLGAVQTYLRRYLWVTAMEIVEHDAVDAAEPTEGRKVANAIKKAKATDGMMESLSEDRQKAIHAISRSIVEKLAQDNEWGAYEIYVEVKDNDEKAALWSLLDSKQRAALKAKHEAEMAGAA